MTLTAITTSAIVLQRIGAHERRDQGTERREGLLEGYGVGGNLFVVRKDF